MTNISTSTDGIGASQTLGSGKLAYEVAYTLRSDDLAELQKLYDQFGFNFDYWHIAATSRLKSVLAAQQDGRRVFLRRPFSTASTFIRPISPQFRRKELYRESNSQVAEVELVRATFTLTATTLNSAIVEAEQAGIDVVRWFQVATKLLLQIVRAELEGNILTYKEGWDTTVTYSPTINQLNWRQSKLQRYANQFMGGVKWRLVSFF